MGGGPLALVRAYRRPESFSRLRAFRVRGRCGELSARRVDCGSCELSASMYLEVMA